MKKRLIEFDQAMDCLEVCEPTLVQFVTSERRFWCIFWMLIFWCMMQVDVVVTLLVDIHTGTMNRLKRMYAYAYAYAYFDIGVQIFGEVDVDIGS